MMDKAEATGFGIALAGHAALLAVLALGFAAVRVPTPKNDPIEVSLVEEIALESKSPSPSADAPAPKLAEIEGAVEPSPAPPLPQPPLPEPIPTPQVQPQPQPRVQPQPQPRVQPQPKAAPPVPAPAPRPRPISRPKAAPSRAAPQPKANPPRPAPKTAPARPAPKAAPPAAKAGSGQPQQKTANAARPTGRLSGLLNGVSDAPSPSRSTTPPAQQAGPAVQASLARAIREQLKPHWKAPTGADAEQLRTQVTVSLSRSGAVAAIRDVKTTGITASNRSQVSLHQEQAVRAVRLAAPFRLPAEFYDAWKVIQPSFDRRLSQ